MTTRTPILRAWALKYLVNIKDYDIWTLNVLVASPRALRNNTVDRKLVSAQVTRLNEIRKKGRVTLVDEMGDSKTVKVTDYSIRPRRQETDAAGQDTSYVAVITCLEM